MGTSHFLKSNVYFGKDAAGKDVKFFGETSGVYMLWDASLDKLVITNADVELAGDLVVTLEDISLADDCDLEFGTGTDALMRWSTADDSNHALVLALGDTSQQLHITDKGAVATDWARAAGTHPEVAIHSNTTPITDYLAIGNHDGTTAHIDVVGGTTLSLDIAGTAEVTIGASDTSPATTGSNALGTGTKMWSDLFLAEGGVINWNNGNCLITHSAGILTVTGDINASNAAGPAILDEAATATNPTLCPDKAEEDTGLGWESDTIHIVLGGSDEYDFSTTTLEMNSNTITDVGDIECTNAAGPTLQNEAATATNPTLIPNRAEEDTGIGWASDVLHVVLGGADEYDFSATALTLASGNNLVVTEGAIDLSNATTGNAAILLNDNVADALSITRDSTDMMVFNTAAPSIDITPPVAIGAGAETKLSFWDTDTYISSPAAGQLKLAANAAGADDIAMFGTLSLEDSMQIAASTYISCLGTGATGLIMKNLKNAATSALSGAVMDVEIDIGGFAYYFPAYRVKA